MNMLLYMFVQRESLFPLYFRVQSRNEMSELMKCSSYGSIKLLVITVKSRLCFIFQMVCDSNFVITNCVGNWLWSCHMQEILGEADCHSFENGKFLYYRIFRFKRMFQAVFLYGGNLM